MQKDAAPPDCPNHTGQITINTSCRLLKLAQSYADENGNTLTGVLIGRTTRWALARHHNQ